MEILYGTGIYWRASLYAGPLVAGPFIMIMMIKPFFARPVKKANPYSLEVEQAPVFHAFVAKVADAVGAGDRHNSGVIDSHVTSRYNGFASLAEQTTHGDRTWLSGMG